MDEERPKDRWRLNIATTAGIMATVMIALILAQLDALQMRGPGRQAALPIVNAQATAIAGGSIVRLAFDSPPGTPIALMPDLNPRPDMPAALPGTGGEGGAVLCGLVPSNWLLYTVKAGDTVESLATGTGIEPILLATANCLTDGRVVEGMQILLPKQLSAVTPASAETCGPPQWWVRYQVVSGDTLSVLAARRGTTVQEILTANCRDSLDLTAGQMIFLPPGGAGIAPPLPTPTPPPTLPPTIAPSPTFPFPTQPPVATFIPTATPTLPSGFTPVPPTATPPFAPTVTATQRVTATPPVATNTPPPPTNTPPVPTNTPPVPTNTPPVPTNTPPIPTDTPVPPTNTPPPPPTDTPVPPTDTPVPPTDTPPPIPTDTPEPPPTDTPVPEPTQAP